MVFWDLISWIADNYWDLLMLADTAADTAADTHDTIATTTREYCAVGTITLQYIVLIRLVRDIVRI